MNGFIPPQSWTHTTGGRIFLFLLTLGLLILLAFGGLVAYYTIQIARGNGAELAATIRSSRISVDSALAGNQQATLAVVDVAPLMTPQTPIDGPADAPLTLVMFIDFECPFCQQAFPIVQQLRQTYGDALRVVFKHFPIASLHPLAYQASEAAACAWEQGSFWEYYELVFQRKNLSSSALSSYAETLGLDMSLFEQCIDEQRYDTHINDDLQQGIAIGVRGTPTYVLNGRKIEGSVTKEEWDTLFVAALNNQL